MTLTSKILAALLLASAASSAIGCGDDDDNGGNGADQDAGTQPDSGNGGDGDAGGGNENDAGTGGDSGVQPVTKECPKHENVTANNTLKVCVISAPANKPIVKPLTLSPVEGYQGYVLSGLVYVGQDQGGAATPAAGATGTTLKVTEGTVVAGLDNKSGLVITRGSKLEAVGSEDKPVVFTSANTFEGSSQAPAPQDWGGIVLMGRAKQNKGPDPVTELDTGKYGGDVDDDNSGILKYVRVEFTGSKITTEKEFNGVTFYAVGSKTEVDYLHVHGGSDDSIEFFGGSVNVKHVVITGPGDDAIDWTDGWRGKIQYAVVQQYPNFGDNGIEADNQSNQTAEPVSNPTIANFTLVGSATANGSDKNGMLLRLGTKGQFYNGLVLGFASSCLKTDTGSSKTFAGDGSLAFTSSRVSCGTNFVEGGEAAFATARGNETLASADVFKSNTPDQSFDLTPKDGSGLSSGGQLPAGDSFFEEANFIGAFGAESWIKGSWVKITPFTPK